MGLNILKSYRLLAKEFYSGQTFVAFDTETTGIHASTDFLLEIGAVKFNCNGKIGESFDMLIKPPVDISSFTTELTGITNEMVCEKEPASKAVTEFLKYIDSEKTILVAHNAPFDVGFINAELGRMNFLPLRNKIIDTLPASRWAYPDFVKEAEKGQYKLQSLAKRFNIEVFAAHRAQDDARVCMELFKKIIQDTLPVQKDYKTEREPDLFTGELF